MLITTSCSLVVYTNDLNEATGYNISADTIKMADIYDQVSMEIEKQGLYCECQGGGRIRHDNGEKKIHVYGYSMGFGRAKHEITTQILKVKYPDYTVTWADEGY
ncbi:14 kDa phosphohistidine phosphatase isoform X2 [Mobula birostris]|uniref:14 kDa phosphohistidine phosphatase isoform X2 n=1 Tax=Mobula birostris TaxID=1983395 RepID=UPI003B281A9A